MLRLHNVLSEIDVKKFFCSRRVPVAITLLIGSTVRFVLPERLIRRATTGAA